MAIHDVKTANITIVLTNSSFVSAIHISHDLFFRNIFQPYCSRIFISFHESSADLSKILSCHCWRPLSSKFLNKDENTPLLSFPICTKGLCIFFSQKLKKLNLLPVIMSLSFSASWIPAKFLFPMTEISFSSGVGRVWYFPCFFPQNCLKLALKFCIILSVLFVWPFIHKKLYVLASASTHWEMLNWPSQTASS